MTQVDRRAFLLASTGVTLTGAVPRSRSTQAPVATPPAAAPPEVTRLLANYVVSAKTADVPAAVRKEAARTVLNWMGAALGGCRHQTMENAIAALSPFSGPAQASILGRHERLDIMHAALMNGISSHVLDFDDTHQKTIIHPAAPVIPAILALAEYRPLSGSDFLTALVLGAEVECRIGNMSYPRHYDTGWHITGTAGVFGAAAAVGKLIGLSEQQMVWALGLASTQPVGLQEMFGTMTKSFPSWPRRAERPDVGHAGGEELHQLQPKPRGELRVGHVLSASRDYAQLTRNLGDLRDCAEHDKFFRAASMHPTIDGRIQLRNEHNLTADAIARVDLQVHPLVLQLTNKKVPAFRSRPFSIYHGEVALIEAPRASRSSAIAGTQSAGDGAARPRDGRRQFRHP